MPLIAPPTVVSELEHTTTTVLDSVRSLTHTVIGDVTYVFAGGFLSDGIQAMRLASDGTLTAESILVEDIPAIALDGVEHLISVKVGENTFLIAASDLDQGISLFNVALDEGVLAVIPADTYFWDDFRLGDGDLENITSVATVTSGFSTFVIAGSATVTGYLTVFQIDELGGMTVTDAVADNSDSAFKFNKVRAITTLSGEDGAYVYASGTDGGISAFALDEFGALTSIQNLSAFNYTHLDAVQDAGGSFVYAVNNNRLDSYVVGGDGTLTLADTITPGAAASDLKNVSVGGERFVAITSEAADMVKLFAVSNTGALFEVTSLISATQLDGATEIYTVDIDGDTVLMIGNNVGDSVTTLTFSSTNDNLIGTAADEGLFGFAGRDTLEGGGGADLIAGGTGTDTARYTSSDAAVTIDLAAGTGLGGHAQGDILTGIEYVEGSSFGDSISGGSISERFWAQGGDDTLSGGGGSDRLYGQDGRDLLDGGDGNDRIDAGGGNDTMSGGAGTDRFVFYTWDDVGIDRITDFDVGADIVDLRTFSFESFEDVLAATTTLGGAAIIDLGEAGEVRLLGVAIEDLTSDNFWV